MALSVERFPQLCHRAANPHQTEAMLLWYRGAEETLGRAFGTELHVASKRRSEIFRDQGLSCRISRAGGWGRSSVNAAVSFCLLPSSSTAVCKLLPSCDSDLRDEREALSRWTTHEPFARRACAHENKRPIRVQFTSGAQLGSSGETWGNWRDVLRTGIRNIWIAVDNLISPTEAPGQKVVCRDGKILGRGVDGSFCVLGCFSETRWNPP